MTIQIFGSPKSFDTNKADRDCKEGHIQVQSIARVNSGLAVLDYAQLVRADVEMLR